MASEKKEEESEVVLGKDGMLRWDALGFMGQCRLVS
jgi:hypothetical protein